MRTAILYSGQARSIAHLVGNHRFHLLRKLPNPTLFVSVADDEQAEDAKLLAKALPEAPFFYEKVKQPDFPERPEPVLCGYPRQGSQQGVFRQLWHLNRVWDFVGEQAKHADFDLFVRVRCDSLFMRARIDRSLRRLHTHCCFAPRWSNWGGINDRFALLGRVAARVYFTTFASLEVLLNPEGTGAPIHPETLIYTHLTEHGIMPESSLSVEFRNLRMDGNAESCEVTGIDLLDAAKS